MYIFLNGSYICEHEINSFVKRICGRTWLIFYHLTVQTKAFTYIKIALNMNLNDNEKAWPLDSLFLNIAGAFVHAI
jgi:hypothetical protein